MSIVTSVWSNYGHTFMGTSVEDIDSCLTCGAEYQLVKNHDGFASHDYVNGAGSEPRQCSGRVDLVHGIERHCEADNGRPCIDAAEAEVCEHTSHVCDCILCD